MADGEQGNKTPTSQRRPYYQNRGNYSNRGRGRHDPHVSKALHNFGVPDLRDWLNKKHEQEGQTSRGSGPPPDPSYSYLKDPLRENPHSDDQDGKYKEHHERAADSRQRGGTFRGFKGKRGSFNRDERRSESEKTTYIQNPVNIKVELTTLTGERSYKFDEDTKLADIKHVPDRNQQERRSFRGERDRGGHDRGRGRGRGRGESSRGRGESNRGRGESNRGRGEMSRGRGDWGRGGRGRGGRGFGQTRGQGRYNPDRNRYQETLLHNIPTTEVPTEENWDDEGINQPPTQSEDIVNKDEANVEHSEEADPEEYYEDTDELHRDYEEGGEYLEASEGYEEYSLSTDESHPTEESDSTAGVVLEETLIITSSAAEKQEENGKRTVRFKLDGQEDKSDEGNEEDAKIQEKAAAVELTKHESGDELVNEAGDSSIKEMKQEDVEDLVKAETSKKKETPSNEETSKE